VRVRAFSIFYFLKSTHFRTYQLIFINILQMYECLRIVTNSVSLHNFSGITTNNTKNIVILHFSVILCVEYIIQF
jgi:hypothetical protein